jgi:hypothetical protein
MTRILRLRALLTAFVGCLALLLSLSAFTLAGTSAAYAYPGNIQQQAIMQHGTIPLCSPSLSVSPSYLGGYSNTTYTWTASWSCAQVSNYVYVNWGDNSNSSTTWYPWPSGSAQLSHSYSVCSNCTVTFTLKWYLYNSNNKVQASTTTTAQIHDVCCPRPPA